MQWCLLYFCLSFCTLSLTYLLLYEKAGEKKHVRLVLCDSTIHDRVWVSPSSLCNK